MIMLLVLIVTGFLATGMSVLRLGRAPQIHEGARPIEIPSDEQR